ncbi:hypothetical protein [Nocardia ignorata]|uniref:hypothetical protein n=1 Tax=Nocardia ignorata TaxID=145285 RepID=UPI000B024E35|nr:hypothetical protein [Nocardia ignorata]
MSTAASTAVSAAAVAISGQVIAVVLLRDRRLRSPADGHCHAPMPHRENAATAAVVRALTDDDPDTTPR